MSNYFSYFPTITYADKQVIDIFRRADVIRKIKNASTTIETYLIQDGETPEQVSYKLYGTTRYHWILLLVNDIEDPFYDWCLSTTELDDFVTSKYGDDADVVRHYVTNSDASIGEGFVVDSTYTSLHRDAVTNREFETTENEVRRQISVVRPEYLTRIETEFAKKIRV